MLNGLDLFSGIAGFTAAMDGIARPVAYCENDRYAQAVLLSRMRDGRIPIAPIWDDIRSLQGCFLPAPVDFIWGGFPCQDISIAGLRAGLDGERSGLFFEIIRLVRELRPEYICLENTPGIFTAGFERVLAEFVSLGYDCRWTVISAEEVGAPFLGERWFLLAKAMRERYGDMDQQVIEPTSDGRAVARSHCEDAALAKTLGIRWGEGWSKSLSERRPGLIGHSSPLGEPNGARLERAEVTQKAWKALSQHRHSGPREWPSWLPEPGLPRGHDGLSRRMAQIRCSGNACPELQYREAIERLMGLI